MRALALAVALAVALAPTASATAAAAAGRSADAPSAATCPGGRARRGDVGLRGLICSGPRASCAIYVDDGDGFRHELAVEQVVGELAPAAENEPGGLRRGDVLVAVDGLLVTTVEGGRRLVDLVPGRPVDMVVRRDGEILQLTLTAGRGCGVRSLRVLSSRVSR